MSSATQQDRSKNKEDTWKSEELNRHLKASQLDEKRHKERRQRRNEDREEHVESRQKYNDMEKKEEQKEHRTRERYGDKDMDTIQNHQREKDKGRAHDRDNTREKYSAEEIRKSHSVSNDYVSEGDKAMRKRRDVRDISDKSKQGDYDNEKRFQEGREKEERRRERGYDKDREQRHRKHREEFNIEDPERRRSEHNHAERSAEDTERERRRNERKHKERSTEDVDEGRRKSERKHKEASSEDVDQERRKNERKHAERSLEDADRERRRSERKHRDRSTEYADRERCKAEQKHLQRSTEDVDEERRKRERKHKEVSSENFDRERRRERKHREKYTEDAHNVDRERRKRDVKHREGSREDVERAKLRSEQKPWERSPTEERHHGRSEAQSFENRKPPLSKEKIMHERERKYRERENREGYPDEQIHRTTEESENEGSADQGFSTKAANEDSANYEEDFEDYDDDFENDSDNETMEPERNPEIEAIQRAMMLENEKIASFPSAPKQKECDETPKQEAVAPPVKEPHRGVFIDFASAKQRQVNCQIASKQKKRSTEILRLIDLDFSATLPLLDLHPVKEYEMYMRNFGRTNTKQAYVQCNEDNVDREVQTEEIDIEEQWTQHPGEGTVVSGGHKSDASENLTTAAKIDSQRLTSFLQSACQVIAVLLEEDRAEKQSDWNVQSKEPCMSISDGCFQLNTSLPFLQARQVYHLHFSPTQRHMLLTLHGLCKDPSIVRLDNSYIICVWNVWEPSTPQKVLICDAEVKCCCFSPGRAALVFAGTVDGSVAVWDLREDPTMHHTMKIADTNWTFRSATFSTDGVFTPITHRGSVRAIEPVPSAAYKDHGLSLLSSQEVSGFSFQIASLDESAHLVLWVVVELRKVDLAGSQNDLGLIPGGKIKLVHSSSIHLDSNFFSKDVLSLGVPQTLNIKFLPQDSNHFVIGTDIGIVVRGTRYGLTEPSKQYQPRHGKLTPSKVTAIDFSPFGAPAFLAGCSDGCIRLHSLGAEFPIMQWSNSTGGQSVAALQWSLTRPTVFFVLDAAFCIYIWDLMKNDLQPVAKETAQLDQILCMATLGEPEKNNGLTGLALAKASGKVDIQYIKKIWAKCQTGEMEKLQLLLHEIL